MLPTIIDLGFVNAFLVPADDGFILIDTGVAQQWKRLEAELLRAGCLPDRLKLVVITHGDADHAGGCARLQRQYRAQIAIHPADAAMVKTGVAARRTGRTIAGKVMILLEPFAGVFGRFDTFQPDILLEDGQTLDAYGLAARVIHTPGHTKGSIAILTEDGQLFIGDTVSNRTRPDLTPFIENRNELRDSIGLLKSLDARMVYPGHGNPFSFESLLSIEA
jgi:hydroxyacylglutathione hydrolase